MQNNEDFFAQLLSEVIFKKGNNEIQLFVLRLEIFLVKHIYIYNIIKLKSLFVCLNALISGTTSPICKILSVLDSPFIEEGYRLW
jgi:hypothetical protein